MDISSIRRENLRGLLARYQTASEFAEAVGTAAAYVSQIMSPKIGRGVGDDLARKIEKALDLPYGWMDARHGEAGGLRPSVPLLSGPDLRRFREILMQSEQDLPRIETTAPALDHTFAIRVEGDSMEPDLPHGAAVIIEPALDALPGDFVLVVFSDDSHSIRGLVHEAGAFILKPSNPRYPIVSLPEGAQIIGPVRELTRRFR